MKKPFIGICSSFTDLIPGHIGMRRLEQFIREGVVVHVTEVSSLRRFKDEVKEVGKGYECGIMLANFNDIKDGDVIETFKDVEEQVTL